MHRDWQRSLVRLFLLVVAVASSCAGACRWLIPPVPIHVVGDPNSLYQLHQTWVVSARRYAASINHPFSHAGVVPEQALQYLNVARHNASIVCETGFFRGMSAHMWLSSHELTELHTFDMHFPKAAVAELRKEFGGDRLIFHEGSTRRTLPRFRPARRCDIVSIDAGHEGWDPYEDLRGLLPNVRCGATIFFDDTFDDRAEGKALDNEPSHATFYNPCTRSYWRAVREGLIRHVSCTALGKRRWSWGRFPKGFCRAEATCRQPTVTVTGTGAGIRPGVRMATV